MILGALGTGSFGRVMLAMTSPMGLVAIKVVHKPHAYRFMCSKGAIFAERDCMATAATRGLHCWSKLRAAWEDDVNFFYVMVRLRAGCWRTLSLTVQ